MMARLAALASGGKSLTYEEARGAAGEILAGTAPADQTARLLSAMASRGETADELAGMLDSMMGSCIRLDAPGAADLCGTGGDKLGTFNISTAASFIAAAAGTRVAKHGNRGSSGAGSADVLEKLGCDLGQGPEEAARLYDIHGICFAFAPAYHPAVANAAPARRMAGGRTIFNLLGPLANPARPASQLVGVSAGADMGAMARLLEGRGTSCIIARSACGADELVTASACEVLWKGRILALRPGDVGLHESDLSEIRAGGPDGALGALVGAVSGGGPRGAVETAAFNAGAALAAAGAEPDIAAGVAAALDTVKGGRAYRLLERFVRDAGDPAVLEGIGDG
ncbi:MAG: anthranilate phosphoribosyltransferase [Nitrosopumilus sp.]|nr:anthranilate phosphoribosyltransferase [Nitrosopumilus sp.]MDA7957526.1 anthranilate phosphoribosyltransferase [Nitrosopumilus sp.]